MEDIGFWIDLWSVVASYHMSLHSCKRSLFARGLSIDSHAYVISQHACWPIGTSRPTCANQYALVIIETTRPKANSIHTAAGHKWTQTPARNIVQEAVFSILNVPASIVRLSPSCHFDLGGSRHDWGLFLVEETDFLQIHYDAEHLLQSYPHSIRWLSFNLL